MHGTRYDDDDGRLVRVIDHGGACHAQLDWDSTGRLVRLVVDGAVVDGAIVHHPLLGDAHTVGDTAMTALDWARPTEIPAIAEPARLPPGAGGAILNVIALLARRAGIRALRYAGPYPTAALWRSLARSFRCDAGETAFTADALARAVRVARDPIPIDFQPAPHERIAIPHGFVELRYHLERAVLDGISYEPGGSPARLVGPDESDPSPSVIVDRDGQRGDEAPVHLVGPGDVGGDAPGESSRDQPSGAGSPDSGQRHCEVWFADTCYARVATLSAAGALVAGPLPLPACTSPVLDRAFPPALCDALADLVADAVPAALAADARALCAASSLRWADLGARAARELPDGFAVHAALWDRIAPLGLARLALALAEALAPVVAAAIVRRASPRPGRQAW